MCVLYVLGHLGEVALSFKTLITGLEMLSLIIKMSQSVIISI